MTGWHEHLPTSSGAPALRFYEQIVVVDCKHEPGLRGKTGWVLGVTADDEIISGYAIFIEGFDRVLCFECDEVEGTGLIAPRAQFYPN